MHFLVIIVRPGCETRYRLFPPQKQGLMPMSRHFRKAVTMKLECLGRMPNETSKGTKHIGSDAEEVSKVVPSPSWTSTDIHRPRIIKKIIDDDYCRQVRDAA